MVGYIICRPYDSDFVPFFDHPVGGKDQVKGAYNRLGGITMCVYTSEEEAVAIASLYPTAYVKAVLLQPVGE